MVDPETQKILGPFQEGELCVKGPSFFNGYLGDTMSEGAFDNEGWFYTGDLAFYDHDEDFLIVGRLKHTIKYKLETVMPKK